MTTNHANQTCVGCHEVVAETLLLHIVTLGDELVLDMRRQLPGPGAYVHGTDDCIRQLEDTRLAS